MKRELGRVAAGQQGSFSRAQALRWYTAGEIRGRLRSGQWQLVLRGVYRERASPPGPGMMVAAAGLTVGRRVIAVSHTAAGLYGFGFAGDGCVHIAVPGNLAVACRPGLQVHVPELLASDITEVDGLLATTPARTAIDVARACRPPLGLATLDGAAHLGLADTAQLADEIQRQAGARGIGGVRELIEWVDGRAESPMESWTRWVLLDAGLPSPILQFPVCNGRYRLDLAWPSAKVAVEYEGVDWHSGPDALHRDRSRRNALDDQGWAIVYATAPTVIKHPQILIDRVSQRLQLCRS